MNWWVERTLVAWVQAAVPQKQWSVVGVWGSHCGDFFTFNFCFRFAVDIGEPAGVNPLCVDYSARLSQYISVSELSDALKITPFPDALQCAAAIGVSARL